jgi:hypothetical protein
MLRQLLTNIGRIALAWLLLSLPASYASEPLKLIIPLPGSIEPKETSDYYEQLLRLALSKQGIATDIQYHNQQLGRERWRMLVANNEVDIIWSTSNAEREQQLLAIKFNLLKGINEHRLLLIRAEDQPKFDQVQSLQELHKFRIGSGTHWSDTEIYHYNGFQPVTGWNFESLFRMLAAKRFDFMARGLQEIEQEYKTHAAMGLAIEQHLMLHYSQPIYFFVNHQNKQLAQQLAAGLKKAQADGSMDLLFASFPRFKTALDNINDPQRILIRLNSPPANSAAATHPTRTRAATGESSSAMKNHRRE